MIAAASVAVAAERVGTACRSGFLRLRREKVFGLKKKPLSSNSEKKILNFHMPSAGPGQPAACPAIVAYLLEKPYISNFLVARISA